MRRRRLSLICGKELLDTVRDRRTLFVAFVLPLLLYPALLLVMTQVMGATRRNLQEEPQHVLVEGVPDGLREHLEPKLTLFRLDDMDGPVRARLQELLLKLDLKGRLSRREQRIEQPDSKARDPEPDEEVIGGIRTLLDNHGYSGMLVYYPRVSHRAGREQAALLFDPTDERSAAARKKVYTALTDFANDRRRDVIAANPKNRGLLEFVQRPVVVEPVELASKTRKGAYSFAPILGVLLVIMALTGAFYPAVDLVAGEKERGTLETLLVAPVSRTEIVLGKFCAIWTVAMVTALLNLVIMGLTFSKLAGMMAGGGQIAFSMSASAFLVVTASLIPTAALFSALALAISAFATSYKEGQHYLTPLFIAAMPPMMMALLPNVELTYGLAFIPVANIVLLVKAMLLGGESLGPALVTVGAMMLYAGLALAVAVSVFKREEVLFRTGAGKGYDPRSLEAARTGLPTAGQAVLLFFSVVALFFFLSPTSLPDSLGGAVRAVLWAQLGAVLLPTLLFARGRKLSFRETFRLAPLAPRRVPLLMATGVGAALLMAGALSRFFPDLRAENLERAIRPLMAAPLPLLLVLFAVLPPLCEELLFRGFVLSGFRARFGEGKAVVLSAILFGALHMELTRILPTAVIGLLLGFVLVRTGSLLAPILVHAVYNGLLVTLSAAGLEGQIKQNAELLMVGGVILVGLSIALLERARPAAPAPGPGVV